jgi:hypothetical protein
MRRSEPVDYHGFHANVAIVIFSGGSVWHSKRKWWPTAILCVCTRVIVVIDRAATIGVRATAGGAVAVAVSSRGRCRSF